MKDNIDALRIINKEDAPIFIQEALRHYAHELVNGSSAIVLVDVMRERFRQIAESYLEWETPKLERILTQIEAEDYEQFRGLDRDEESSDKIDWNAIEEDGQMED